MSGFSTPGLPVATSLTGDELIAADTQLGQGLAPESEAVSVDLLSLYTPAPVTLTDGTTIATDASLSKTFSLTLTGNHTLSNPTNLLSGQNYRWIVTQDASGNRTLAYGTLFKFSGASTLTTTIGAIDMISAVYNGTVLLASLQTKFV